MRIKHFSLSHTVGSRPNIELCLFDVTSDELAVLRNFALHGDRIKIESKEKPMYGMSRIEFTPRDVKVKKVIFNNPATIVFWSDGTKTVVKCGKGDTYDKEKGFYIACAKKLFGNDYKAVGRMNKALEMAVTQTKLKRMTMDDILLPEEDKNGR